MMGVFVITTKNELPLKINFVTNILVIILAAKFMWVPFFGLLLSQKMSRI